LAAVRKRLEPSYGEEFLKRMNKAWLEENVLERDLVAAAAIWRLSGKSLDTTAMQVYMARVQVSEQVKTHRWIEKDGGGCPMT